MGNKFNKVEFESGVKIIYWLLQRVAILLFRVTISMARTMSKSKGNASTCLIMMSWS